MVSGSWVQEFRAIQTGLGFNEWRNGVTKCGDEKLFDIARSPFHIRRPLYQRILAANLLEPYKDPFKGEVF